ncbi:MAG: chromosomal replication initiator protein DnaA [Erysipelotrichaceae bacterium]|nr:chromosomal replication initiator protein DnaA [Erysipelotrichaceae bacterium]
MTSYNELWNQVLHAIQESHYFKDDIFHTWIENKTSLFNIDNQTAYVTFKTMITHQLLSQENNKQLFESTLSELYGEDLSIQYFDYKEANQFMPSIQVQKKTEDIAQSSLNPDYTFENFVQGYCNQEAYAACLSCCTQIKHTFNPIMIYGNSGLGKTHLLHAIGNYLKKERPEVKVFYAYSGQLVTILLDAMKTKNIYGNTVEQVKEQLSNYDYFLIDDVQNLKQSSSQEVFFTVYNQLIARNAQIVMTSDMHPNELSGLQNRLISRFSSGLITNISKPEFDTSKAILRKKLEGNEESILIQDNVLDYLASKFSDDVRNLEGSLNKLIFNATIENPEVIDLDFAQRILMKEPVIINQDELTMKQIKKAVVNFYGFTYKDLEGKSRQKNIMNARQVFVYLSRELLHKAYVAIGQELGNRDHTTILSSYERARQKMENDKAFSMAVDKVKATLKQ